jgi:putative copper export protein
MALAAVDAAALLGLLLLLGGPVFDRLVLAGVPMRRRVLSERSLRAGALTGAGLVGLAGAADVVLTIQQVLGRVDAALVLDYLPATRHGRATLARLALVPPVAALAWVRPTGEVRMRARLLAAVLAIPLVATFSWTSHAAAMGGTVPLLTDMVHLGAACAWGGSLGYLALSSTWRAPDAADALRGPLRRLSRVGLVAVGLLALTGGVSALTHLQDPARFAVSAYGVTLYVKVALVVVIVAIAAGHRRVLLPALEAHGATGRLRIAVRVEAGVLVAVLAVTGILTTRAVPHAPGASANAAENLMRLLRALGF